MNNKIKKLLGNSIIFAIGNLGSRVIGILMVPLYTYLLTASQYGMIDLSLTVISLLVPILSLSIPDALFRFIMDKSKDKEVIVSSSAFIMLISLILSITIVPFLSKFINDSFFIIIIVVLQCFQLFISQLLRGLEFVKEFAINGILMSLVLAISNIVLLYIFELGIRGYFISIIVTNICSILYMSFFINYSRYFNWFYVSKDTVKLLLKYSIPLIPNGIMWWVLNASSRLFIVKYLGVESNGIFAVSNKIPTLLIVFQTIFFQAWQLSAMEEENEKDSSLYASHIFLYFQKFMFLSTIGLIYFSKPIILKFISSDFSNSWKFVPFLLLGVMFSSLSSFVGTQYLVKKRTSGIMISSFLGALINLLGCYLLIPLMGLQGASISLFFGFFSVYIYRIFSIKRISHFSIDFRNQVINLILTIIMMYIINISNFYLMTGCAILLLGLFLFFNSDLLKLREHVLSFIRK